MPTGTSFEADLRAAREAADLSLSDIQQKTRIPVDVLRRFEVGELIGDPTYNEVYLKAFLQSYAKAVGVPASAVAAAYAAHQQGAYDGSLHPSTDPARPAAPEEAPPPDAPPADAAPADVAPVAPPPAPSPASAAPPAAAAPSPAVAAAATGLPPAVQALQQGPATPKRSSPGAKPKTLAEARVNRPVVPSAKRSFDKNWGTILGLFGLLVVALGAALYFLVFAGNSEPEPEPDTVVVGTDPEPAAVDSSDAGASLAAPGPRLQLPIRVTVTATGGKLQNFRVTEAPNARLGHWMEEGVSKTFESDSLVVLWGEGADGLGANATLELQGQRWVPNTGRTLTIDRARGQAILDSLAAARPATP